MLFYFYRIFLQHKNKSAIYFGIFLCVKNYYLFISLSGNIPVIYMHTQRQSTWAEADAPEISCYRRII